MDKNKSPFEENKSPNREYQEKTVTAAEFGVRLRQAAKNRSLTQTKLARALSLPGSSMGRYWNGERVFPADLAFKAADFLLVDPRWLVTGHHANLGDTEIAHAETTLLAKFRTLNAVQREHLLQSATLLLDAGQIGMTDPNPLKPSRLHSPTLGYRAPTKG